MNAWKQAVKETDTYRTILTAIAENRPCPFITNPASGEHLQSIETRAVAGYASESEMFARSYSQWIAFESGNPEMIQALSEEDAIGRAGGVPQYWTIAEYGRIADAFKKLLGSQSVQ
jgi:hypothetical protein